MAKATRQRLAGVDGPADDLAVVPGTPRSRPRGRTGGSSPSASRSRSSSRPAPPPPRS